MHTFLLAAWLVTISIAQRDLNSLPQSFGNEPSANAAIPTLLSDRTTFEVYEQVFREADGTIHTHTITSSVDPTLPTTPPSKRDSGCGQYLTAETIGPDGFPYPYRYWWPQECDGSNDMSSAIVADTAATPAVTPSVKYPDSGTELGRRFEYVYDDDKDGKDESTVTVHPTKPVSIPDWLIRLAQNPKSDPFNSKRDEVRTTSAGVGATVTSSSKAEV